MNEIEIYNPISIPDYKETQLDDMAFIDYDPDFYKAISKITFALNYNAIGLYKTLLLIGRPYSLEMIDNILSAYIDLETTTDLPVYNDKDNQNTKNYIIKEIDKNYIVKTEAIPKVLKQLFWYVVSGDIDEKILNPRKYKIKLQDLKEGSNFSKIKKATKNVITKVGGAVETVGNAVVDVVKGTGDTVSFVGKSLPILLILGGSIVAIIYYKQFFGDKK